MSITLRLNNNDITISDSVRDATGNAIGSGTGQIVKFKIQITEGLWWNGSAFAEPSEAAAALIPATEDGISGIYRSGALANAYNDVDKNYTIKHIYTENLEVTYSSDEELSVLTIVPTQIAAAVWDTLRASHVVVGSFGQYVNSNTTHINSAAQADGAIPWNIVQDVMISMALGKFTQGIPDAASTTFFKQNGIDVLFVMKTTATTRVKTSGPGL